MHFNFLKKKKKPTHPFFTFRKDILLSSWKLELSGISLCRMLVICSCHRSIMSGSCVLTQQRQAAVGVFSLVLDWWVGVTVEGVWIAFPNGHALST